MDIFRNKKRTVLSVSDEQSQSPKYHKKKKDGSPSKPPTKSKKTLQYQYSDEEMACSSSDSQPSGEEDTDSSVENMNQASHTQRTLARRLTRREKQRHELIRKKKEQNKISMDDFLNKQIEFHTWIEEEKHKIYHQISSPKKKAYFKTFMKLWNKRKLPQKYYRGSEEIHSPQVSQNTVNFNVFDEPDEFSHLTAIKRPKSKRLSVENGGFLDSPFSTFGKTPPKLQNQDKENCTPVRPVRRPVSTFASPKVRTIQNSQVSPILELSEYQIPLNSVRVPSFSSNEDVSSTASGRLIHPYSVMPLPWVTDSDTSSLKSDITDDEDHPKLPPLPRSVVYALPRKTQNKKTLEPTKKMLAPPPVPPKPHYGLVNYCSSVDSNSGYSVICPRSAPDSVSIGSDRSGDSDFKPISDYYTNRSSMSDPGHRNVYASLDSISVNTVESDPGYVTVPPLTDDNNVNLCSVMESDEDLPLPPPPELPSMLLDYTTSDLPPPPEESLCPDIEKSPEFPMTFSAQFTNISHKDNANERPDITKRDDVKYTENFATARKSTEQPVTPCLDNIYAVPYSTEHPFAATGIQNGRMGWCRAVTAKPYAAPSRVSKVTLLQGTGNNKYNTMGSHVEQRDLGHSSSKIKTESLNMGDGYTTLDFLKKSEVNTTCITTTTDTFELENSSIEEEKTKQISSTEPLEEVVSPGYMEMDSIKNTITGSIVSTQDKESKTDMVSSDGVVSPGYMEMNSIKNTITGSIVSTQVKESKTDMVSSDGVVSPGYMEMDSFKNNVTNTVPSTQKKQSQSATVSSEGIVSPEYMKMDNITNIITDTVTSTQDNQADKTNTVHKDNVLSPGYVDLQKIKPSEIGQHFDLPVYAAPEEVFTNLPVPSSVYCTVSDYTSIGNQRDSPGCHIQREPDMEISPNVTIRRGRRRKTLRQGTVTAMDSCPTLEELNLSRDMESGNMSLVETPAKDNGQSETSQIEKPMTSHSKSETPHVEKLASSNSRTEKSEVENFTTFQGKSETPQVEKPIAASEPSQVEKHTKFHSKSKGKPMTDTEKPISQNHEQYMKGEIHTHLSKGHHSDCLSDKHSSDFGMEKFRSNSVNENIFHHDKKTFNNTQHLHPIVSKSPVCVHKQDCNELSQGSLVTGPTKSTSSDETLKSSSRKNIATYHPSSNPSVGKTMQQDKDGLKPSSCGISTSVFSSECAKGKTHYNPPHKIGHIRNPSISCSPNWLAHQRQATQNPDLPTGRNTVPDKPVGVVHPCAPYKPVQNSCLHVGAVRSSAPENPVLTSCPLASVAHPSAPGPQQTLVPCSLTVLTQSPRKLQNFRDRISAKPPTKDKDIKSNPVQQSQCSSNKATKPISQVVKTETGVKPGTEILQEHCPPNQSKIRNLPSVNRETEVQSDSEILETDIDSIADQDSSQVQQEGKQKLQRVQSSETIIW
ncbi:uncharacterized protein [Argopecten irradians]|uniref:uncharacterized protein n=1 Tax=Argopecten irradians TaxID=31199 RepID=UPI003719699D